MAEVKVPVWAQIKIVFDLIEWREGDTGCWIRQWPTYAQEWMEFGKSSDEIAFEHFAKYEFEPIGMVLERKSLFGKPDRVWTFKRVVKINWSERSSTRLTDSIDVEKY